MGTKDPINTILLGVPLTKFEDDVLQLIKNGLTDEEIARKLGYSQRTVSNVIARKVLPKLQAQNRTQAAVWRAKALFINATAAMHGYHTRLTQTDNLRINGFPQESFEALQNLAADLEIAYYLHPDPDWQAEILRLKAQTFLKLARIHHDLIHKRADIKLADPYNYKALTLAQSINDQELIGESRLSIAERNYCAGEHDKTQSQLDLAESRIHTLTHQLWHCRFSGLDHALHQERRKALRAIHKGLELLPDAIAYKLDSLLGFLEGAALTLTLLSNDQAIELATDIYDNAVEKMGYTEPPLLRRGQIARTRILIARKWQLPTHGVINSDLEWEYGKRCGDVFSRYETILNILAEKESYLQPEPRRFYGKW